ncbi:hypothetical protein VTK73DRAFT_488 [Phialemonium thermophilum]|uniref:Uncharacterized protein n=1 Tax=Phialemonium thermophilum TaxID=223376 RepID=A0ABR3VUZ6_9PEZI
MTSKKRRFAVKNRREAWSADQGRTRDEVRGESTGKWSRRLSSRCQQGTPAVTSATAWCSMIWSRSAAAASRWICQWAALPMAASKDRNWTTLARTWTLSRMQRRTPRRLTSLTSACSCFMDRSCWRWSSSQLRSLHWVWAPWSAWLRAMEKT